jgi:hypothetical protein
MTEWAVPLILGFVVFRPGMCVREDCDEARLARQVVTAALGAASLFAKEAAAVLRMAESQWSRNAKRGGWLSDLMLIAKIYPEFGAALVDALPGLFLSPEAMEARRARKLAELDLLNQRPRKAARCHERESSGSSAA